MSIKNENKNLNKTSELDIEELEKSLQEVMNKIRSIFENAFERVTGIPNLSNIDNRKQLLSDMEERVKDCENGFAEFINQNPKLIDESHQKFKESLNYYGKLLHHLRTGENIDFLELNHNTWESNKKALKRLRHKINKLALVCSYQKVKQIRGMEETSSENFNHYYESGHKPSSDNEFANEEFLMEGGRQVTNSREVKEEKENLVCIIIDFIDRYIAGDDYQSIAKACVAVKERRKLPPPLFTSSSCLKRALEQIEEQNKLAIECNRREFFINEDQKHLLVYKHCLDSSAGHKMSKSDNYYRKKHLYISALSNENIHSHDWKSEAANLMLLQMILNKWRELYPKDTDLNLNNFYRTIFVDTLIDNSEGYKLIDNTRKDLFGEWIRVKNFKGSKMWSLVQDYFYRDREKNEEMTKRDMTGEEWQRLKDNFGERDSLIYFFRKRNYSLRETVKELHKRDYKISKNMVDSIVRDTEEKI